MKHPFILILVALLLTACGGTPAAAPTPSPSPIPLTATQLPPSETPTPTSTETQPVPTAVPAESYLSQLDITFESPVQQLKYNGAVIGGQTSVDSSAGSHGIHEVTMTPELQAKLSMRALHNIFMPEEEDNDANLAAFAKKLADAQAGNGSCADFARTISMYDANGSGEPTEMTIVPACGASPVPKGATQISSITFITGDFSAWDEGKQQYVPGPNYPWFRLLAPAGDGSGVMFNKLSGELSITVGLPFIVNSDNARVSVGCGIELTMEFLKYFSMGKGDNFRVRSTQRELDRASTWVGGISVR